MNPRDVAASFVDEHFPDCLAAFVGGSHFRGEATSTSDLDIMVVGYIPKAPYRESFHEFGWPIEAFIHTRKSYHRYFAWDVERRRPSLPTICTDGIILRDVDGLAGRIRQEARELLDRGPPAPTAEEIAHRRYTITDLLDDFAGAERTDELLFIAHDLAVASADLILLQRGRWTGLGKWLPRALRGLDPDLAGKLEGAMLEFYRNGSREGLVRFADAALDLVGGRLWAGYTAFGPRDEESGE